MINRPLALLALGLLAAFPARLRAQVPDSIGVLPEMSVRAARAPSLTGIAGWSLTTLDATMARRGRPVPTLDEVLAFVPGLLARERPDRSLDTRIVIRGAGARANFGVRGVRVLIDGVPATLPDGQTPLTGLDLERVDRAEVARGPIAALHGNGSHGVVALSTPARRDDGLTVAGSAAMEGFAEGTLRRGSISLGAGGSHVGGILSVSRLVTDGAREHAYASQQRYAGSLEWRPGPTTVTLRGSWAIDDSVEAPGALTLAEFENDPALASPSSVLRNAGKVISERRLSATLSSRGGRVAIDATTWVLGRSLENPLAAPPPPPITATTGTWVGIDRLVYGARTTASTALSGATVLTAGVDAQQMIDDRVNRRHDGGVPAGDPHLDQQERVGELGVFAQVATALGTRWSVRGGTRHDAVRFSVDDHLTPDAGGSRSMRAWSTSAALAHHADTWDTWLGAGSAFETPTTTELANRPDGSTGLNRTLEPSRTLSVELGARARGRWFAVEAVAFTATTDDAITPVAESGGRSYFANRGTTHTRGVEATGHVRLREGLQATATVTLLRARFGEGGVAADGTDLTGREIPGVPATTGRLGVEWDTGSWQVAIDQAWTGSLVADDLGAVRVPGWGAGITNLLVSRRNVIGSVAVTLAARNLLDRRHAIGAVVNGAGGRVVEPGAGRVVTLTLSVAPAP